MGVHKLCVYKTSRVYALHFLFFIDVSFQRALEKRNLK